MILFPVLLFLNGLSEYLLNRMMAPMGVLDHTHRITSCAPPCALFGSFVEPFW